jgi:hypothetical protein
MDWKSLAGEVAKIGLPLLGAVLPIPGGAAIGTALASHIGAKSSAPEDILAALTSSAEAVQKAREFEATHQERMLELTQKQELALVQADVDDRKSARQREVDTKDETPKILAAVVVVAWVFIQWHLINNSVPHDMREIIMRVLGTLDAALVMVLNYYFGSSASSKQKDATLAEIAKS